MIELYIENKKIDIEEDLEMSFTYETIDPDKLSSIKNSFSKTVNIPATTNNNITFGHIFRFDKYIPVAGPTNIDSFYDPHKRVEWFINKNGSVINRGYCTLDNILVKSERDIIYQFTFYGGIGEFFYSLAYNEDGSMKTLVDLYWDWFPKVDLIGHSSQTTPTDEHLRTLYRCSADIIARSYHTLNPHYTYSGTTEIDRDVVFVPCYTGLYEDFDSRHMIVSTFNQNYNTIVPLMSDNTKSKLRNSFPDTYTDDEGTYTTMGKTFSSSDSYRYGLVTFARDIDPWEAGDLRVSDLPVAIRLSKLMTVISNPVNNGGYVVEWDDDITQSYHWLYSWVMLGKLSKDKNWFDFLTLTSDSTFNGQETQINVDWMTGEGTETIAATTYAMPANISEVDKGDYRLMVNVLPSLTFRCNSFNYYVSRYPTYISGSMRDNRKQGQAADFRYVWTTPVLIHKIYNGNTLIKAIADVFYFSSDPSYYFGHNQDRASIDDIKSVLNAKINARFMSQGETIDKYAYHECRLENPEVTTDLGYIDTVKFKCTNEKLNATLNFASDASNIRVEQSQGIMWTDLNNEAGVTSGLYGVDPIHFSVITASDGSSPGGYRPSVEAPYGFISSQSYTLWHYNEFSLQRFQNASSVQFNLNESMQNGFISDKISGFNIISLDKKTLFAESQSPMRYLSGYCKLMNYKFICDETQKKIYIKPLKKYYINRAIDINDRVDLGRDISIKNIVAKHKILNIGLESTDTYPIYLFNKKSRDKFNIKRYDTGIEYNATESSLLNDLTFKDTLEWQQSSIFYNIYPQFPRPYSTQSISWTLFDTSAANTSEIKKKEIFTTGVPSTNLSTLAKIDFLPKISLFDKNNKSVDFESTLIFLNGFVKNYDYTEVSENNYVISPRVCFSNDTYEQYYLNQARCYMYDFKYNDTFTSWGCYSADQQGTATSWILPMFSRDLYNIYVPDIQCWNSAAHNLASWNFTNQEGLNDTYSLIDTDFIYDQDYNYTKTLSSTTWLSNEYKINETIEDDNEYTERIFERNWKDYLDDLYDRNTCDVTAYVDLSGFGDVESIMRNIYVWRSHLWIITKLFNFKLVETSHDKFTKVTLHKIKDLNTWTE